MGWFRFVPFIGRLPECSGKEIREALTEVFVATIFSTMPVWLLPFLSPILFKTPVSGHDAFRTGELFLFSAALVGPLVYIISKNYGEREGAPQRSPFLRYTIHFPYGQGFVYASVAICFVSSFAFIVLRNPLFQRTEVSKVINYEGVISLSWFTFVIATMIFFCATAYRNSLENVGRIMPRQEREFIRAWEENK